MRSCGSLCTNPSQDPLQPITYKVSSRSIKKWFVVNIKFLKIDTEIANNILIFLSNLLCVSGFSFWITSCWYSDNCYFYEFWAFILFHFSSPYTITNVLGIFRALDLTLLFTWELIKSKQSEVMTLCIYLQIQ